MKWNIITYLMGLGVSVSFQNNFSWFANIVAIFVFIPKIFSSTCCFESASLSLFFPLGSPIFAVAPPTCQNIRSLIEICSVKN